MKKYLISFTLLILLVILYNPAYWYWHLVVKWKHRDLMEEMRWKPPIKNELITNGDYTNWEEYDFLEFKIALPRNAIEAKKVFDNGILMEFDKFSLVSLDLLAGHNSTEAKNILNNLKEEAKYKVPETYYQTLVQLAETTPDQLSYFSGRESTSFRISQLLEKTLLFRKSNALASLFISHLPTKTFNTTNNSFTPSLKSSKLFSTPLTFAINAESPAAAAIIT